MTFSALLLTAFLLAFLAALPAWPYSSNWGYGPSGSAGALFVLLTLLVATGNA